MDTVDSQALRELEGVTRLGLGRQGTRGTSGQTPAPSWRTGKTGARSR